LKKIITPFEFFIAIRYLFSARREGFVSVISWFSFIGIALGVATLIIVMAVMNGFRQELFGALITMRGHVSVHSLGNMMDADQNKVKLIQNVPGVGLAYPMLEQQAILMASSQAQGVNVQGLDRTALLSRKKIQIIGENNKILDQDNEFDAVFKDNQVFIGRLMAINFNLKVGDSFSLLTPKSINTAFGSIPRQKTFKVAGIFNVGMRDFDKSFIFMPIETAQKFFKFENKWSQIDVFSVQDDLSTALSSVLQQALDHYGKTFSPYEPPLQASDWRHSDQAIFHAVKMERNVMFMILTLIIFIASFNIISGLTMMVKDKTKDIAILRTIGTSKKSILTIFFLIGASIGGIGTILGIGLGLGFSLNIERIRQFLQNLTGAELFSEEIYFLSTLPAKVDFNEVWMISLMSIGLSFLATLYPSWRASCLDPVEGIRAS
jgi:lipoprotein-releasing system permease protein